MADMVASALTQEGVSRASSYISTKLEGKASSAQNMARLEMALSQLEFALEKAEKMPITYISLLRRMKMLKSAHAEGTDLLNKHKQAMEGSHKDEAAGRAVTTRYPLLEWIGHAKNLAISSLLGLNQDRCLSSATVQIFEWYATCADKFVADVESGCPLARGAFRYPFVRQLLEGKTLWSESIRGNQRMRFHMLPLRSDDRGVEAELYFCYQDFRATENNLCVWLMLRISESTDIVGIAVKCMELLTSQLKLAIESAVGELTLLPDLQDVSDSYAPPPACIQESANQVPEAVIAIGFGCSISAPEYKLPNTSAPAPSPLYLEAFFVPRLYCASKPEIMLKYSDEEKRKIGCGMEQMEEVVRTNALDYLVLEQEATDYGIFWFSAHGSAFVTLRKSIPRESVAKTSATPARGRSAAKRKR